MVFCTTLSKKVERLETDLKQTKQVYGATFTKLIKKERYGHDMEFGTVELVSIAGAIVTTTSAAFITDSVAVSTASPTRSTRVSNADDITMAETLVYIRKSAAKDKGKGKMAESETVQTKTKLQQEQERLSFKAVVRLQAELKEEERQRIV
ncbi:hypothetical protein Tco_0204435 [Tanacetum coccineum]